MNLPVAAEAREDRLHPLEGLCGVLGKADGPVVVVHVHSYNAIPVIHSKKDQMDYIITDEKLSNFEERFCFMAVSTGTVPVLFVAPFKILRANNAAAK